MTIDYDRNQLSYALANALRERDEAITRRMETIMQCELYEQERDEAREKLENEKKFHHRTHAELVQTQCKLLDMQMGRDEIQKKYDNLAAEHMLVVNKLCNERDEAIEKHRLAVIHWQIGVAKMERERDDALNQITGWENKWKAAVEMAAIAENKVSNLEDQVDLAMKVIKRLEANKP